MAQRQDMTGRRFGKLTVIEPADDYISPQGYHYARWVCKCDCGNVITTRGDGLRNGTTGSCGCKKPELNRKRAIHGDNRKESTNRLYSIWANMLQRCSNSNRPDYKFYGGRCISVCDEWHNYVQFKVWAIAHGYADNLTLDRIDPNGNYEPDNCRWLTIQAQQNNKRSNHYLTYNNTTMSMSEWADVVDIPYSTIRSRVNLLGWSAEKALTTPVKNSIRTDIHSDYCKI